MYVQQILNELDHISSSQLYVLNMTSMDSSHFCNTPYLLKVGGAS